MNITFHCADMEYGCEFEESDESWQPLLRRVHALPIPEATANMELPQVPAIHGSTTTPTTPLPHNQTR